MQEELGFGDQSLNLSFGSGAAHKAITLSKTTRVSCNNSYHNVDFQGGGRDPTSVNGLLEGERQARRPRSAAIAESVTHCVLPERQDQGHGSLTPRKRQRAEGQGKAVPLNDGTTETFLEQRLQHFIE
jgi:hypothetical protein